MSIVIILGVKTLAFLLNESICIHYAHAEALLGGINALCLQVNLWSLIMLQSTQMWGMEMYQYLVI